MRKPTPQEIIQAYNEGKIKDETTLKVFVMMKELENKIDEELPHIKSIISKVKGEDGHTPTDKELIALIKPLIPEPIKGEDGRTPTDKEILALIRPLVPKIENGKTPTKKELLELIIPLIPKIDANQIVVTSTEKAIQAIKPLIPDIKDIEKQLPQLGEEIRDSLELLMGDERLDSSAIRGLPELKQEVRAVGASRGLNVYVDNVKKGILNTIDFVGASHSKINGRDTLTFEGDTDEKVKYDADDPTAGYVADKFVAGTNITLSEGAGADENKLKITGPDLSGYATTDYVDEGTWLMPPIIDWFDPTLPREGFPEGGLPEDPEIGDRYGADGTGYGWTYDYIYEWDGDEWVESEPEDGWMIWVLWEMMFYAFFSGGWMEVGSDSYLKLDGSNASTTIDIGSEDFTTAGIITGSNIISGDGVRKITVGTTEPTSPAIGDLWVDTN